MSHFTKNTKVFVTDKDAFIKACQELGIKGKVTENTTIKAWDGSRHKVAMAINCGQYDIGLEQLEDGKFSIVGDWWGIKFGLSKNLANLSDEDLQNKILQNTTKQAIVDKYGSEGFDCSVVEEKSGAMQITLTRSDSRY